MTTTEFDMNELLKDILYDNRVDIDCTVTDYVEAGVLTNDTGFVIKNEDGSEFQVTVKQSR